MRLFAIGDTHLSFARPKPMHVFDELWRDHPQKIAERWDAAVGADDVVLVVGDISWAHTLEEARPDLDFVHQRTGRLKVLLKGNHDSWWNSAGKVRGALPESLRILHNDALRLDEGVVLCGARGWNGPGMESDQAEQDARLYQRELARLDRSLEAALALRQPGDLLVALAHYPPVGPQRKQSAVLEKLTRAGVAVVAYGHLHGGDHAWAPEGWFQGPEGRILLRFVAADAVDFTPQLTLDADRAPVMACTRP